MILVSAGGPSWTDRWTAIGTVAAVIVALGIALWTEWRSGRRLKAEHERSDRLLAEERAYGRAQLEEERSLAHGREQLAEAYAVQVVSAGHYHGLRDPTMDELASGKVDPYAILDDWIYFAALIVNHGSWPVTQIEVQFSPDGGALVPADRLIYLAGFEELPKRLTERLEPGYDAARPASLAPWDTGLRFESSRLDVRGVRAYPIVRWNDRWGTRWEHKRGEVRQVTDDTPWEP
jgi:hypothetical protein